MRRTVLAVAIASAGALLTGLTGCKHPGSAKFEGHWRGTRAEGISPVVHDAANAFATQSEITARGNLITISVPGVKGQQSAYVVDEESKGSVVLHTDKDANKETFTFADDGKTMTWRMGDGRSIVFQKLKD